MERSVFKKKICFKLLLIDNGVLPACCGHMMLYQIKISQ